MNVQKPSPDYTSRNTGVDVSWSRGQPPSFGRMRTMVKEQTGTEHASLKALISGAEKMFDNAEHLFFEAEALAKAGGIARSLFLHQISLEECSKISTLGAWAVSLLVGLEVDQKKVLVAFGRHEAKNKQNAYMLKGGDTEKEAIARGDWKAALEAFKPTQDEFHRESNQAKNGALYVDWLDGEFVSPNRRITDAMLADITVGSIGMDRDLMQDFVEGISSPMLNRLEDLVAMFERGEFDLVALGRVLLADPDWLQKVESGKLGDLTAYNRVVALEHYEHG